MRGLKITNGCATEDAAGLTLSSPVSTHPQRAVIKRECPLEMLKASLLVHASTQCAWPDKVNNVCSWEEITRDENYPCNLLALSTTIIAF